ncbi:MAG: hypothetical protein GEV09_01330 [Pseudonocardiaceae bacterium]|nr:hypothetical protein [Pseudonocardiaceae bacterium]
MSTSEETNRRSARAPVVLWLPGLLVALAAAVATAHGLYEVAHAAGAPAPIAGLYPLITDGLALVAYATTARLSGTGRRYAWAVVVLAAGLSGLAQASYLAGSLPTAGAGLGAAPAPAPAALRFGVGAWPAVAAAIVAHLLYLLATIDRTADTATVVDTDESTRPSGDGLAVERRPSDDGTAVQPDAEQPTVQPSSTVPVLPSVEHHPRSCGPSNPPVARQSAPEPATARLAASPARDRARNAAHRHEARHGARPTVSQLMSLADVSRGTAGEALKDLRDRPAPLHVVHPEDEASSQR